MKSKTIEERCSFDTQRLDVSAWTHQVKNKDSEKNFAEKIIEILSPNVTKALPDGWQNISTIDAAQKWIKARDKDSHFLSVQLMSSKETIGFLFLYESHPKQNDYELRFGYLLSEKVWAQGLGTELMEGFIKWCKMSGDIKSVSGGVEPDNIASIRVLEKTGFSISSIDNPIEDIVFYEYQINTEES